jgi:chromosome partitioning protein
MDSMPERRTIAVANQKGGVGKTTTAVNLSTCLALTGKHTLLIDLDPQANSTSFVGIDKRTVEKSIYDVLVYSISLAGVRRQIAVDQLDVVPSSIGLVGAEVEMLEFEDRETRLREALTDPELGHYDFVIIDCPPSLNILTVNALAASQSVLIPMQCEYFALEGLGLLLETIKRVQGSLNPGLSIEGVLLTMYDSRLNLSKQVEEEARRFFAGKVYQTVIPRSVRLSEAPGFGKPIALYDTHSTGAVNYASLAQEVITP